MSTGPHRFKLTDLRRALNVIRDTGVPAKVVIERDKMTVVPTKGDEPPAENDEVEKWINKHHAHKG